MPLDLRVIIEEAPYRERDLHAGWSRRGIWPCRWIACAEAPVPPFVTAYRRRVALDQDTTIRVHVAADERYELFLDGTRIGRGNERGDAENWYFETYDLPLAQGGHVLVARVWSLGEQAPFAQMSVTPGFLLSPDEEEWLPLLATGVAPWEAAVLRGYTFTDPNPAWGTGANLVVDGQRFDWGFESGECDGWSDAVPRMEGSSPSRNDCPPCQKLRPATLPAMLERPWTHARVRHVSDLQSTQTQDLPVQAADHLEAEDALWGALLGGSGSVTLPAYTRRRVLVDLTDYLCAYPQVVVSGGNGGLVRIHWQEALYTDPRRSEKGNRDEIEGKRFVNVWMLTEGVGDTFKPDGGSNRLFETLWWQCGRYVEIVVETQEEPLTLERVTLRETRYPLEMESSFTSSERRLAEITPLMLRTLQMCAHETYMDCPFFEQLMYIGDTRLEVLLTYAISSDDRLPRKALRLFDASCLHTRLTQSRYPTRIRQVIPTFSLWYIAMIHDFMCWRGDLPFIRSLLPGARGVIDHFAGLLNPDGLVQAPDGWNTLDWVPEWPDGVPPDGARGVSGVINWQFAWALGLMAELEAAAGEPELALRAERLASDLASRLDTVFWNEERGLYADDTVHLHFSEHAQCLAVLSHRLPPARRERIEQSLFTAPDLARTTIYFSHYLFETCAVLGRTDILLQRMNLWFDLRSNGLKTTIEMPEPTRSDCHAWGSHPLFHYFATILGIRPGSVGFTAVQIAPNLGLLTEASGSLTHPLGQIRIAVKIDTSGQHIDVTLPDGLTGVLIIQGQSTSLKPGRQTITARHPEGILEILP